MAKDYKEYDPQVLERLHNTQLDMLTDINDFCDRNGIKYFVHYGCMIGAVRHKGFIPWDDDIDLSMIRSDYNRFIELARKDKAFSERYEVLGPDCAGYPLTFAKVSKKGTKFVTDEMLEAGLSWGINLDIFPLDAVPQDLAEFRKRARKAWVIVKLLYLYYFAHPHIPGKGIKRKMLETVCWAAHGVIRALPMFKPEMLQAAYLKNCLREETKDCQYVDYYLPGGPATLTMRYDEIYPTLDFPFEDRTIRIPNQYDRILKEKYGDYMKMPPVEKRRNHAPEVLDFGDE